MLTYYYCLIDPQTNDIKYIGSTTTSLRKRLHNHVGNCHKYTNEVSQWIYDLKCRGLKPCIKQLDYILSPSRRFTYTIEKQMIKYYTSLGHNILNHYYTDKQNRKKQN